MLLSNTFVIASVGASPDSDSIGESESESGLDPDSDSTLVESELDSTSVDSDSSAMDSDSGLMDSGSDSTPVDSESQWVHVSPVENIQGKFKLSYAITHTWLK